MPKILLVCTGNTCRSPMAQALFLKYLKEYKDQLNITDYQVLSAGLCTQAGLPASREAIEVMAEENIDLNGHRSMSINESLIDDADVILTMSIAHREFLKHLFPHRTDNVFDLKGFAGEESGDIKDPYGAGLNAYRKTLQELKELIPRALHRIITGDIKFSRTEVE